MNRLCASLAAASLFLLPAFVAQGHEGDDHGVEKTSVGARSTLHADAFRRSAESTEFEIVVAHEDLEPGKRSPLHLYVSDWRTNAPVEGARIEITEEGADSSWTAVAESPGVYRLDYVFAKKGYAALDIVVRAGETLDLLAVDSLPVGVPPASLASAPGSAGGMRGSGEPGHGLPAWAFLAFAGLGLLIAAVLWIVARSARRRRSARAFFLLFTLGLAAAFSESARAQSTSPYMAKEAQFLIGLRTEPAREETLSEGVNAFGTVVADPSAMADLVAPQTGKLTGTRSWKVGDRIARGEAFGSLLVVDELPVRAPIAGTISEVLAVPGQTVAAGQTLARVVSLDRVRIEIPLYGEDLGRGLRARSATVRVSALPEREFEARIEGLAPGSHQGGPAVPLVLSAANKGALLRPGMVVEITLALPGASPRVTVPAAAILRTEKGPVAFVKTGPETFELRNVTLGTRHGDRVAIERGVSPGERVVTSGGFSLFAGSGVRH